MSHLKLKVLFIKCMEDLMLWLLYQNLAFFLLNAHRKIH